MEKLAIAAGKLEEKELRWKIFYASPESDAEMKDVYKRQKLHGQDPEFYNSGGVAMPIQPQVVFSLDLGF